MSKGPHRKVLHFQSAPGLDERGRPTRYLIEVLECGHVGEVYPSRSSYSPGAVVYRTCGDCARRARRVGHAKSA